MKIGLIGLGAMGNAVIENVLSVYKNRLDAVYVHDLNESKIAAVLKRYDWIKSLPSLSSITKDSDFLIEAASALCAEELMPLVLKYKKNVLIMSAGGLLNVQSQLRQAEEEGLEVIIPHGAIAGLDAIASVKNFGIKSIKLFSYKPAQALEGSPYIIQNNIDLVNFDKEKLIFKGSVKEAIKGFAKSINISATLLLISGLNDIEVNIYVSKDSAAITHIVEVESSVSNFKFTCRNFPSPYNPKTSALAVCSICLEAEKYLSGFLKK
ncbi:MAG: DUF108 domain-containing protein [Candidatus Omnitrophica bacterium]|nr:DUF108 domain-containing protein [Candidatus Omnitrophota bacterium]